MLIVKFLIFLWNALLKVNGSLNLISSVSQIVGGGTVSAIIQHVIPVDSATVRVILAVFVFILFMYLTNKLVSLFRDIAAKKILKELRKADNTGGIIRVLSDIDKDLSILAKELSKKEVGDDIKEKNALGMLQLLFTNTDRLLAKPERKATQKDAFKLSVPLIFKIFFGYSVRRREYLFELAVLMDKNNAGLNSYDDASNRLMGALSYVSKDVINNAYIFLKWSYGINSLLLLTSRDLDTSVSSLPSYAKVRIHKLLYERDHVAQVLLTGIMIKIGVPGK